MISSRRLMRLSRVVFAWFACVLTVAVISPLVNPKVIERLCAADGTIKLVQRMDSGEIDANQVHTPSLDCPLCLPVALPPKKVQARVAGLPPQFHYALTTLRAAHISALARAPLPARGPPSA